MYFDFQTYWQMLRLARREQNRVGRRRMLFVLLILIPIVSTFHALCFALDRVFFPRLRSIEVRTPVFIVGHARSGTTLMHRLMSADGERFSCFLMYELFFPSLLQKKAIRLLARGDRRFLGGRVERALRRWEARRFAETQDMHRTGLSAPEEDDAVNFFSCASGIWIVFFPYMGELDFYFIDQQPPRRRRRLMSFYRECIKRQLYLNGADKIHLSKNPTFSGRVESLIEAFPDARIVVMMRNPTETIPSLLKLLQRTWQIGQWDEAQIKRSLGVLAEQSFHTYRYPLEVLARHPNTKHAIVDYRDLIAEPKRTVEHVYEQLGFAVPPALSRLLSAEEQRARAHETTHHYSLEEFGLSRDAIRLALADLFDQYQWNEAAPAAGAAGDTHA